VSERSRHDDITASWTDTGAPLALLSHATPA